MNFKMMGRFIAQIIAIEAAFMVPALAISLGYGEWAAVKAFAVTLAIMLALSGIFYLLCRRAGKLFGAREGLVCVSLSWLAMSLLGALPFVLCGQVPSYIDALFEIISGFTTTGASVIANVEGLYKDFEDKSSFISRIGVSDAEELISGGYIGGGMLPKLNNCTSAVRHGVNKVHILDGRIPHCLLLEIFTHNGIGTAIVNDKDMERA